jgi:hypothetical protein
VQRTLVSGFDDSFRRHLAIEQRRAVLDTIARELGPDTTLGDIVDAAQELGWNDIGELCLADLAGALAGDGEPDTVTPTPDLSAAANDEEEDEDEDETDEDETDEEEEEDEVDEEEEEEDEDDEEEEDEEEDEEEEEVEAAAPRRGRKAGEAAARKPSSMDRALDRIDRALAARARKSPPARAEAKPSKPAKKTPAKKTASKKAPAKGNDDDSEAMSLDQAAKLLIPLVRKLKEATMQDLEEQTGMGRRKLRFHIGQLVKHGRLKRHGMGRGTCYTVK